jgi:hypothetical protein
MNDRTRISVAGRATPLLVLLIAIALITLDQLQGMGVAEVLRVGVFFAACGGSGRQFMGSVLKRAAAWSLFLPIARMFNRMMSFWASRSLTAKLP